MINAGTAVAYLTLDHSGYTNGLVSARQQLTTFTDTTENAGTRLQSLGGVITGIGSTLSAAVTVPLVAAGAAMTKFAMDYESSVAKVSSIADTNAVSIDKLSSGILNLSNNTGISASELNNSLYETISAGIDTANSVNFMTNATKLAKAGFADIGSTIDVLTSVINSYGMKATDVTKISDILIQTQNLGKTTVGDLSVAMGKVIPTANAYGVTLEQLSTAYVETTKNGIATAESTTYINAMINELGKSGTDVDKILRELTGKGFKGLMQEGKTVGDVLNILNTYATQSSLSMGDLFGSVEAAKAAMVLAKNEGNNFNDSLQQINSSAGLTDKTFKTVTNTTQEKLTKAINKFKNEATELGTTLLPLATDMIKSITKVADKFNSLDDSTKKNIVSIGGMVAAAGPMLLITGKMVTGIGSMVTAVNTVNAAIGGAGTTGLITGLSAVAVPLTATLAAVGTGFYLWHEANDLANRTITKSREELSWAEKAIADLTGQVTYSRKELEEMGIVWEEFSEDISPDFQKSIKDNAKELWDFQLRLNEITLDKVVTEEEANEMVDRLDGAFNRAIEAIDSKQSEIQSTFSEAFTMDGIVDENETILLEFFENEANTSKEKVVAMQEEVNELRRKKREEGYEFTDADNQMIMEYYTAALEAELEAKSTNEAELIYAQNQFQERVKTMDAESSSEMLKERRKQYDDAIIDNNAYYDTLIELTRSKMSDMDETQRTAAETQIAEWEQQKQQKNQLTEDMWNEDIKTTIESNENLRSEINRFNGEMLKDTDKKNYDVLVKMSDHYTNLDEITQSGYQKVYNETTKSWDDIYVKIDETTGKLSGVYDLNTQKIGAMTRDNADSLNDEVAAWSETAEGILINCIMIGNAYTDAEGNIRDASNNIIGKVQEVKDKNGQLVRSIQDINGNPIKIGDNAQEVINRLINVQREIIIFHTINKL